MGCDGRSRARQSEAGRCARSVQHRQGGLGGQRLPLGRDRGGPEGEALAEPYPPACRTQSSAVRAPEVGEHDALEGARPCRARIRPPAELDGRQDRAYHRHCAGEVQDRDDEPRLQHPPVGSARAGGGCARLSALTGEVRVASCKRTARSPAGLKTVPDRGLPLARALQPLAQPRQKSRKAGIVRGALVKQVSNGAMKLPSFVEATYGAGILEWVRQTYEGRLNFKGATSTVEAVTGRKPQTLEMWVRANRQAVLAAAS